MKPALLLAAAAALAMSATSANALITVRSIEPFYLSNPNRGVVLYDFDNISNPYTTHAGGSVLLGGPTAPPFDNTRYASVGAGQTATFTITGGKALREFSFFLGVPEAFNRVTFNLAGGGSQVFQGSQIFTYPPAFPMWPHRVSYDFGGATVSSIEFYSASNAFEYDGLAGTLVPEPGAWALMILGLGATGAMLRRRRAALA